ncbi:MAG: PhoH family protein [Bacilli bacterium]
MGEIVDIVSIKPIVLDTSALMKNNTLVETLLDMYQVIIPIVVVSELDNLKTSENGEKACGARQAIKQIEKYRNLLTFDMNDEIPESLKSEYSYNHNDDIIVGCAKRYNAYFMTNDLNLKIKASALGVECIEISSEKEGYKGYKEISLSDEEMAHLYSNMDENKYNCMKNEYLLVKDNDGKIVDRLKWNGKSYVNLSYRNFKSRLLGQLKPLDDIQQFAFDTITNNDISVLFGKAGTGKSQIPLSYILQGLESQKIKKCYVIYHFEPLKNAKTLGYVKGEQTEKFLNSASIGNILSSKFGDISEVERLINSNLLQIVPTANIRGFEAGESDCVYVTEAQDLDIYTLKTIIQRCKTGCKQIYEGDILEQSDIGTSLLGIKRMIEVFKGSNDFGVVKLKNNYRSPNNELADLM